MRLLFGLLLVVAAALGAPGHVTATFPWSALGHARDGWWEGTAWAATLLLVTSVGVAPRDRGTRGVVVVGMLALAATVFVPWKFEVNRVVPAEPQALATPLLGAEATRPMRWTRATLGGSGLTRVVDLVGDEWLLMRIAGGAHQDADRAAVARGDLEAGAAARAHTVRRALWGLHQGVVLLTAYGRVALAVLAPLLAWLVWRDRAWRPLWLGVVGLAWAMPVANAVSLLVVGLGLLPDDRARLAAALTSASLHLGVAAGATRLGMR